MFVGHLGWSFAAKKSAASVPLWCSSSAVSFLISPAPLVPSGDREGAHSFRGSRDEPLDLYYTALLRNSLTSRAVCRPARSPHTGGMACRAAGTGPAVVASRRLFPTGPRLRGSTARLPIYDEPPRVGLGLWNFPRRGVRAGDGIALRRPCGSTSSPPGAANCPAVLCVAIARDPGPPSSSGHRPRRTRRRRHAIGSYVASPRSSGLPRRRRQA